jgi:hypothetical protein
MRFFIPILLSLIFSGCSSKSDKKTSASEMSYEGTGYVTKGRASINIENLLECDHPIARLSAVGMIEDHKKQTWTVPGLNHFENGPVAHDLYNDCSGFVPSKLQEINLDSLPVVEIDPDGQVISGFIFADNYFELYINSQLIAIDPVPYTPFNSSIVKFKVKRPYLIAMKLIDWEEDLGIGSENFFGTPLHAGDGGVIASFSDGTITNENWKAQTFYTSPIKDLGCLSEDGTMRLSSQCNTEASKDGSNLYGLHWMIPENSFAETFDDNHWPNATTYTEEEIGIEGKNAYTNFIEKFSGVGAKFIWSTNIILDNEVIVRYKVE